MKQSTAFGISFALIIISGFLYFCPSFNKSEPQVVPQVNFELPRSQTIVGYWECLPHKNTGGPQTLECAFGLAVDQSDGHYAIDTALMSMYPVDYPVGTKVRVTGIVTPANQLSSIQKYDIDGIIRATVIEKVQ